MRSLLLLVVLLAAVVALGYLTSYNRLVTARQRTRDAWAAVDVELQRRHQLIPGLVASVAATAVHERTLLVRLVDADRRAAQMAGTADDIVASRVTPEAEVAAATRAVIALREMYPALNSQQNFLQLQHELAITEDRIGACRRFHNIKVADYNRRVQAVPGNLVARRHGFVEAAYFGAD